MKMISYREKLRVLVAESVLPSFLLPTTMKLFEEQSYRVRDQRASFAGWSQRVSRRNLEISK